MKLSGQVKPISYLKAHASEIIRDLENGEPPLIITQRGEAKAVILDIASYEESQETLALLRILALGEKEADDGEVSPVAEAFARIRRRARS